MLLLPLSSAGEECLKEQFAAHALAAAAAVVAVPAAGADADDDEKQAVLVAEAEAQGGANAGEGASKEKDRGTTADGVAKTYVCLVGGAVAGASGEVDAKLRLVDNASTYRCFVHPDGKPARTRWRRLASYRRARTGADERAGAAAVVDELTLLSVTPLTGRTHQIRAHMAHLGTPIVGDTKYNRTKRARQQRGWCPRMFLHARRVRFCDIKGRTAEAEAPLAPELQELLDALEGVPGK